MLHFIRQKILVLEGAITDDILALHLSRRAAAAKEREVKQHPLSPID